MNLNVSIAEWVNLKSPEFPSLDGLSVLPMGDTADQSPPFLAIYETGADQYEQDGVVMKGITKYQITCDLVTVPANEDQAGTSPENERIMRTDLSDILQNEDIKDWIDGRNFWAVIDFQTPSPITEAQDGTRVTRWVLSVLAHPI